MDDGVLLSLQGTLAPTEVARDWGAGLTSASEVVCVQYLASMCVRVLGCIHHAIQGSGFPLLARATDPGKYGPLFLFSLRSRVSLFLLLCGRDMYLQGLEKREETKGRGFEHGVLGGFSVNLRERMEGYVRDGSLRVIL